MSKKGRQRARAEPAKPRGSAAWLCDAAMFDTLACRGYVSLAHNPEIAAARRLGIPVYKALREPIVRRFGEEFYRALEAAEEFLREQERRP